MIQGKNKSMLHNVIVSKIIVIYDINDIILLFKLRENSRVAHSLKFLSNVKSR